MGIGLIFIVLIGLMWLMRTDGGRGFGCCGRHHSQASDQRDSMSIARERYAKGEISQEEFREIKEQLNK